MTEHHEMSDEEFSKATQRRIGKEVAKRKVLSDDLDHVKSSFETAKEEAADWRKRAEAAEMRLEESDGERLKREKAENKEKLKQAFEDGDTEKQTEYTQEFSKLTSEETEYERRKRERVEKAEQEEKKPPVKEKPGIHPSAQAFLDRSKGWLGKNAKARERAIELEKELHDDEAMDYSDELYAELDARLFEEMPELAPKKDDDQEDDDHREIEIEEEDVAPKREVSTVTPKSRGNGKPPRRHENGAHMSDTKKATMRRYGLDPKNPEHIKGFLKHHTGV